MGPGAVAFFVGAREVRRSNDTHYPFRQDSDFWYLTGFDHPDALAVLRTDGGPAFTLLVQPREPEAETWTGYRPGPEGARADYGADDAHSIRDLERELPKLLERAERVFHVFGTDAELDRMLLGRLEERRQRSRLGLDAVSQFVDPRSILHEMRLRKSEAELELMRRAADISDEAHREAARLAQPGRNEYELEAMLDYVFRRRGGSGPAYASIVGGGANATVLHYIRNDQPLPSGAVVLIDAGVELEGYASDVTRTYPIGGRFEAPQRDVYDVVLEAQDAALEACAPGITLEEIHDRALRVLVEGMIRLGLVSGSVDEVVADESYRPFYMHRTSHWLGLDVHDVGAYSQAGKPRVLEPGMVFTVEPGLYVPAHHETAPESLRGIGVRIEDDVVVTAGGCENLTAAIPKQPAELEALVQG
ncbi:MAG: aminopeptidase P N-terminal domain-containing protein [Proteobacteria bacterium]|nr:aminopeptidase P N-terminal domain-containing protein [Pseudomonadota bacterium]